MGNTSKSTARAGGDFIYATRAAFRTAQTKLWISDIRKLLTLLHAKPRSYHRFADGPGGIIGTGEHLLPARLQLRRPDRLESEYK